MSTVYRFTGPPENWITGITLGKWAVNDNNKALWEKFAPGDIALLHSTAKSGYSNKVVSSVIGYAVIASGKWTKDSPWWIQEKEAGANLWPYVFTLDEVYLFSDKLSIDFNADLIDKSAEQIKREVEQLASTGLPVATLNDTAKRDNDNIPNFPVNGSASRVNPVYENLVLNRVEDYYLYSGSSDAKIQERLAETIDGEIEGVDKDKLRQDALRYAPASSGYETREGVYVVRKDDERQKRIVAKLEDYKCQVCGFKCAYTRLSGKQGWIIEVDHIIDKADGGNEELSNLWALCPNCHRKKTRGVITIDPKSQVVREDNTDIQISDNHLGWKQVA
jgi:hypothetical protein